VLLSYRLPREPSTPRIAVWRALDRLGVARLGDGLVGLPADARTREQLEWVAQTVLDAGGAATVWLATPASGAHEEAVAESMRSARAAEYEAITAQVERAAMGGPGEQARTVRRLRAELRRIARRDFFPTAQGEAARVAVEALTEPTARDAVGDQAEAAP
jgi:hypothetical protein